VQRCKKVELEDLMRGLVSNNNATTTNDYSELKTDEFEDIEKGKVEQERRQEQGQQKTEKNRNIELLKLSWSLVPSKLLFLSGILLFEIVSSLSTIGLLLENKLIVIVSPIIICLLSLINELFQIQLMYKIKSFWLETTLDYFYDLPWISRMNQEDMTDFHKMINSSSNTLFSLVSWGIPTIITGIRSLAMVIYILIVKGYWNIIIITAIIYYLYFAYVMKSLQEDITTTRTKMKEVQKIIVSKRKWLLQLFKNKKRTPQDTMSVDLEFDILEKRFIQGWEIVTSGVKFISAIISFIGLLGITNWNNLLLVKIIFDELRYTIETFSRFSNSFTSRAKDFDKYLTWYEETEGRETKIEDTPISSEGLKYNVDINLQEKFFLESKPLSIIPGENIVLRGPTGVGKTQLMNALQGLIPGANLFATAKQNEKCPRNFQESWEYLDQNMRETIPSNGLTLRETLGNISETELIWELIQVVKLEDKIISLEDIDEKMKGFSGGQRMKVSLIFVLLELILKAKKISSSQPNETNLILVLDEPEQGLDPYSRLGVVFSILHFCQSGIKKYIDCNLSVLMIYHGDDTDLIMMNKLITKIWLLKKHDGKTIVEEVTEIQRYCRTLLEKKKDELKALGEKLIN
jgi:ABC-type transport system involved in cytochrome bd biosynthesis fused ATPase/permease subunit